VVDSAPKAIKDTHWSLDPVDHFILAKQEEYGVRQVADADRYTWLRRVSLDLTGLPPTEHDVLAFARDTTPQAFENVVDRLLASKAYGERWARHWLDLTGYADMIGTSNSVFAEYAWRYRDYLINAFNADKPFDEFIREQIAGDLMPSQFTEDRAENIIATGFLMVGDIEIVNPDKAKMETDHIDTQMIKIGQTFMGMTLGCARCHDHKFDPIGLEDYYGIAGVLRSSPSSHKMPDMGVWSTLNSTVLPETPAQLAARKQLEAETQQRIASLKAERQKLGIEKDAVAKQLAAAESAKAAPDKDTLRKRRDELDAQLKKLAGDLNHAEFFQDKTPRTFAMGDGPQPGDMPIYVRGNPYAPSNGRAAWSGAGGFVGSVSCYPSRAERTSATRRLACRRAQPAHGPRHGEPDLAESSLAPASCLAWITSALEATCPRTRSCWIILPHGSCGVVGRKKRSFVRSCSAAPIA